MFYSKSVRVSYILVWGIVLYLTAIYFLFSDTQWIPPFVWLAFMPVCLVCDTVCQTSLCCVSSFMVSFSQYNITCSGVSEDAGGQEFNVSRVDQSMSQSFCSASQNMVYTYSYMPYQPYAFSFPALESSVATTALDFTAYGECDVVIIFHLY